MSNLKKKMPITEEGKLQLEKELKQLEIEQQEAKERMIFARSLGDLKENNDYHESKELLKKLKQEINLVQFKLKNSVVLSAKKENQTVSFGSVVEIKNLDNNEIKKYHIVSDIESDVVSGKISQNTPLAQILTGKAKGEEFYFITPSGMKKKLQILNIQ